LLGSGWKEPYVHIVADDAPFCSAFLDPVLLGLQRQLPQELAGLPDLVQDRRRGRRESDYAGGGGLHRAVLLFVRSRRPARRPLRQVARGAAAQACRDPRGRARRAWPCRALTAAPV